MFVIQALESLAGAFTSEVKTSSKSVPKVPGLLSGSPRTSEPESENVATGLIKTDSVVGEAFGHETVTIEPPIAAASLAVEDKFTAGAAKLDSHGSPKCESLVAEPHATFPQAAAAVEETRLIPARPETPFTATRGFDGFMEEADKHPYFSTRPHRHLVNEISIIFQLFQVDESTPIKTLNGNYCLSDFEKLHQSSHTIKNSKKSFVFSHSVLILEQSRCVYGPGRRISSSPGDVRGADQVHECHSSNCCFTTLTADL